MGEIENVEIHYFGRRLALGSTREPPAYCIWDQRRQGEPIERFPATTKGWAEAWAYFTRREPRYMDAKHLPKCPTCGSERVQRVTGVDKAATALIIGIFSLGRMTKTYDCLNCGASW